MGESVDSILLHDMDAYWRAANYLSVSQMYLRANPLLRGPLKAEHVKPRVLGRWGSAPGHNFIHVHLNRVIKEYDLEMLYIAGPGHSRPALRVNAYLAGTYSELCPDFTQDETGLQRLLEQFSITDGLSDRSAPEPLDPLDEAGQPDRPLCRAYGAVCGKPDLLVACVVGDIGANMAASLRWEANQVVNPATDGAVLPILHLTGLDIANSTILPVPERERLCDFLRANDYRPYFVEGDDPAEMHALMAQTLDAIVLELGHIQTAARLSIAARTEQWPVLIVCTPGGWTGPKTQDTQAAEATAQGQQTPLLEAHRDPAQLAMLEAWLRSYRPWELFDRSGRLHSELAALSRKGGRPIGSYLYAMDRAPPRDRP